MTALDILGGLFGPPLVAALFCFPRRWRHATWFLTWWLGAAEWVIAWCWAAGDSPGARAGTFSAASAIAGCVLWWRQARRCR